MSVLGKNAIKKLLAETEIEKRLFITPILEETQITESSIDVRLGNDFIATKKGSVTCVDPSEDYNLSIFQTTHRVNLREKFILHPKELVLASTLEYVRLPLSVSGYVTSRSSWGRSGLVIATATIIHPGFKGVITLELINLGEVPIVLYPGLAVAQLVLHDCKDAEPYKGQFAKATTTMGSKISTKKDINKFWLS